MYELSKLDNHFLPQFKIPYNVIPFVDLMCKLSLPNKLIDTIANQSTIYAKGRTRLPIEIPVNEKKSDWEMKKNLSYLLPSKFKPITGQDILYFLACYYYMGYCRLPARSDYWRRKTPTSCLPSHWMDGIISRDKFEYLWRNISLLEDNGVGDTDSIDNNVSDEDDDEFVDDNDYAVNNNDISDNDDSDSDEEEGEEDDNNNNNINNDGSIDYDTVVDEEEDDDDESWLKKASFMID